MYQQWQNDPSIDSVIKLIEERESREIHKQNYNARNSESGNWGIMSLRDVDAPTSTHPPYQNSSSSSGRGEPVSSRRRPDTPPPPPPRRDEAPLGWRTGRELAPVARFGLEIASRLTQQMRVARRSSSSSEDDRRSSRSKRRQDTPEKRIERKRRSSRSGSEGRKRSRRSRSHSRPRRGRSGSRDKKRHRSKSRERKRDRSTEGKRDRSTERKRDRSTGRNRDRSTERKRDRSTERKRDRSTERKRDRSTERKRDRSTERKRDRSTERKRDRSTERNRDIKSPSRERALPTATQPKQTAPPASVNDATSEMLSKFISIIKDVKEKEPQIQKVPFPYKDVLPEFDPVDKANAIVTWITRVDDIAKLFGWEEKEILQYAMPKLAGIAKVWYLGRKDFIHSWAEWKKKLVDQFPCPDFWQMLEELKQRKCEGDETLENYFHEKMILVKRCGIRGRQAVDCVLQGVAEEAVRLFAAAAQFDEPEELLRYLQTAETIRKKVPAVVTPAAPTPTTAPTTAPKTSPNTAPKNADKHCTYCNKFGHLELTCQARLAAENREAKKNKQCTKCMKYGHEAAACWDKTGSNFVNNNPVPLKQIACHACGKLGHKASVCRFNKQQKQPVVKEKKQKTCFFCGVVGHVQSNCYEFIAQQQALSQESAPDTTGSNVAVPGPSGPVCHFCREVGHIKSKCSEFQAQQQAMSQESAPDTTGSNATVSARSPPVCHFCGVVGHTTPKCFKFKAQKKAMGQESAPDTTGPNMAVPGPSAPGVGDIKIEEPPPPGVDE